MLKNEKKLWKFLNKYCISKLSFQIQEKDIVLEKSMENIDGKFVKKPMTIKKGDISFRLNGKINQHLIISPFYSEFNVNMNRAVAYYPEIIKIDKNEDFFNSQSIFLFQSMHILLITALEVYLRSVLHGVSMRLIVNHLDMRKFVLFLKEFNLRNQFLKKLSEVSNLEFLLSDILPERMDLQQKKKCKVAFNLIGIDVVNANNSIWEKIYSTESGYLQKRHIIIHGGPNQITDIRNINNFNINQEIEELENAIIDIVQFVFYIENQRFFRYPDLLEIPFLEGFQRFELDSSVRNDIIIWNYEIINNAANYDYECGYYETAMNYYELLIKVSPESPDLLNDLGLAYVGANNYAKAIETYKKALKIEPDDEIIWENLGLAYENNEQIDKAKEAYKKSIKLEPDNSELKKHLKNLE